MYIDIVWLKNAINFVKNDNAEKVSKDNITVYKVKNIIRIDIKE